ncbi:helix-turn-helix domain-containing protein [Desulfoferrobacter suflitae]|uniref:helix-turn-helix domain-containing protein n=1 Tax=Desulfoferrobacter suflitae TaxID=2865782 RepID=UPI00216444AF|nr:helix-turn-helix transcriptional regulator [Desulfoferrobacter suflitae]MCK8600146.1 helix-turn-helix domain-containing protein [Desulfoferrobacter suflitae]
MGESQVAFGKRIRKLREQLGLTQTQLAEKANLSVKHLGEFERGRGNPTFATIENLAEALHVSPVEMFAYDQERLSAEEIRTEIHEMIDTIDDERCRLVHKLLRSLFR